MHEEIWDDIDETIGLLNDFIGQKNVDPLKNDVNFKMTS